jgi:hypothetical protein
MLKVPMYYTIFLRPSEENDQADLCKIEVGGVAIATQSVREGYLALLAYSVAFGNVFPRLNMGFRLG